jgi:glycosyltransferase involved in cell wall biosynthesis
MTSIRQGDLTAPRISVIIAVKNGERYVGEALRSILAQTLTPYEIIVVDGQSTDRTVAIALSFANVRCVVQVTPGLAHARNAGLAAAEGEWIAFLDYDDLWDPDKLRVQTEYMLARPHLQYTTTLMRFIREPGAKLRPELDQAALDQPRPGLTPSALLARRSAFDQVGLFDPMYTNGADADWFARAQDLDVPTAIVPTVLLIKRLHHTNLSIDTATTRQDMFRIVKASLARRQRLPHA